MTKDSMADKRTVQDVSSGDDCHPVQNGKNGIHYYTAEDVQRHNSRNDRWLIVDGHVYDISKWTIRHPGGGRILSNYGGQDATEAFTAFHKNMQRVEKYLPGLRIGKVKDSPSTTDQTSADLKADFEELRQTAQKMGLFKPSRTFYALHLLHILLLEVLGYCVVSYWGQSWLGYVLGAVSLTAAQNQAGWTQHDYGHLSVFQTIRANRFVHYFVQNVLKGASVHWWNYAHYSHHSKPNIINKDPDISLEKAFVFGSTQAKTVAQKKDYTMPYSKQHQYFFIIGPPLIVPIYFQYVIFRFVFNKKLWLDIFLIGLFYTKFFVLYTPLLGLLGALKLLVLVRVLEGHWFVWVTQMNHIVMNVDFDSSQPWVTMQLKATCNVEKSFFNDWFSGHLNFQIEHHLFPTMPRHNLYKVQPLVKSLCSKYNIPYIEKSLPTAFKDIVRTLKTSGQLWMNYYEAYHLH